VKGLRDASHERFVDELYLKLLARSPDPDGRQAMLALLAKGVDRLDVIDVFLRSEEFNRNRHPMVFAPPGHFYSPHPGPAEIAAHRGFDWDRAALPGIDLREAGQLQLLDALAMHYPALPFGDRPGGATRYGYDNNSYSYGDGVLLFCMLQHLKPRRIIEVGSGNSSCAILDAVDRMPGSGTSVTFIEPYPKLLQSLLRPGDLGRHTLHAQGLQQCPLALFQKLEAGDVLFVDSSHVAKLGSDVNYLVFEILPALAPGVWVHIHDIFFPFEYPPQWYDEGRAWNEAYVLRAFLEFNEAWRIELFSSFMLRRQRAWFEAHMPIILRNWGGQIWLSRQR
jgi:hypothetical protein